MAEATGTIIGMVAAMPEEIAPLLKRVGGYRKEKAGGRNLFGFQLGGTEVALIESGMGPARAAAATRLLLERVRPRLILNFGFGGGVRRGAVAGDLVLAQRVLMLEGESFRVIPLSDQGLSEVIRGRAAAAGMSLLGGTFITAATITSKEKVSSLLPHDPHPVLEMETAAILEVAAEAGVPMVAVRGISDAADEELDFSLDEFTDPELNLKISRVLLTVAKRPRIIPQLIRLARNSSKAGKNLARLLEVVLPRLGG